MELISFDADFQDELIELTYKRTNDFLTVNLNVISSGIQIFFK